MSCNYIFIDMLSLRFQDNDVPDELGLYSYHYTELYTVCWKPTILFFLPLVKYSWNILYYLLYPTQRIILYYKTSMLCILGFFSSDLLKFRWMQYFIRTYHDDFLLLHKYTHTHTQYNMCIRAVHVAAVVSNVIIIIIIIIIMMMWGW